MVETYWLRPNYPTPDLTADKADNNHGEKGNGEHHYF